MYGFKSMMVLSLLCFLKTLSISYRTRRDNVMMCCFRNNPRPESGHGTSGTTTNDYSVTYHAGETDDHNYEEIKGLRRENVYNEIDTLIDDKNNGGANIGNNASGANDVGGGLKEPLQMTRSYSNPKDMVLAANQRRSKGDKYFDDSYTYPYDKVYRRESDSFSCNIDIDTVKPQCKTSSNTVGSNKGDTVVKTDRTHCIAKNQVNPDTVSGEAEALDETFTEMDQLIPKFENVDKTKEFLEGVKDDTSDGSVSAHDFNILMKDAALYGSLGKDDIVIIDGDMDASGDRVTELSDTDSETSVKVELRHKEDRESYSIGKIVVRKSRDSNFSAETSFIEDRGPHQRNSAS